MPRKNIFRVGLTGGIGSGKSTVAMLFSDLGIDIIDADIAARTVVEPGQKGYNLVVAHFGHSILNKDRTIDRQALRNHIFSNTEDKQWLEQTLHPLIREIIKSDIEKTTSAYCIVVVPLLAESKQIDYIDRVLVVDTPEHQQIERVTQRDACDETLVKAIISTQSSREHRLNKADDIILNDSDLGHLKTQVILLHDKYCAIANEN